MKRQLYVVPALMLVSGVVWSHGYPSHFGPNPLGTQGNPNHSVPTMNPYSRRAQHFDSNHYRGRLNNPDAVSDIHRHQQYHPRSPYSVHTPYGGASPYTPYSTPNRYRIYSKPYAPDSVNPPYDANIPYDPGNIANPYGTYSYSYNPSTAIGPSSANAQQFYNRRGNYIYSPYNPNSVSIPYVPQIPNSIINQQRGDNFQGIRTNLYGLYLDIYGQ